MSSRTRLKPATRGASSNSKLSKSYAPAPLTSRRSASREKSSAKSPQLPQDNSFAEQANGNISEGDLHTDDKIYLDTSVAAAEQLANLAAPAASHAGSSVLSEPEDAIDEKNHIEPASVANNSIEDIDTEAETERLYVSPQKGSQSRTSGLSRQASNIDPTLQDNGDAEGKKSSSPKVERRTSPTETRKRKRNGSGDGEQSPGQDEPRKRRSTSDRQLRAIQLNGKPATFENHQAIIEDESDDLLSDATDTPHNELQINDIEVEGADEAIDDIHKDSSEELSEPDEGIEDPNLEEIGGEEGEGDVDEEGEEAEEDVEDDEAEATGKSEQDIAKKRVALDDLVPIENLFAIFRDKLFDERLAMLSAELDQLKRSNPTHPDYQAQLRCLDVRRDEKIRIEKLLLEFKTTCLENRVFADRSQLHSQYFQTAREIREKSMENLNEHFTAIQRERRQMKPSNPRYVYNFEARRGKQIANQVAYNKEVSILSGIAKYVGFPAAPQMEGAKPSEIEEDMRAMRINRRTGPTPSYAAQLANATRQEDAVAEEQWAKATPWANPHHPIHQQAQFVERPSAPSRAANTHTPTQRQPWVVDLLRPSDAGPVPPIGQAPPSEPPSVALAAMRSAQEVEEDHSSQFETARTAEPANSKLAEPNAASSQETAAQVNQENVEAVTENQALAVSAMKISPAGKEPETHAQIPTKASEEHLTEGLNATKPESTSLPADSQSQPAATSAPFWQRALSRPVDVEGSNG